MIIRTDHATKRHRERFPTITKESLENDMKNNIYTLHSVVWRNMYVLYGQLATYYLDRQKLRVVTICDTKEETPEIFKNDNILNDTLQLSIRKIDEILKYNKHFIWTT